MKDYFKYLTPSEEDKNWGLYLNVTGTSRVEPNVSYPLKTHPSGYYFTWEKGRVLHEYQVLYITEGFGVLETRDASYNLTAGSLMIISPGKWHRYRPNKKTGWVENFIGFDGRFARQILATDLIVENLPVINCGLKEEVVDLYNRIFDVTKNEKPGYQQVASGDVVKLIGTVLSHIKNKDFSGKPIETIIEKIRQHINDHFNEEIDFAAMASQNSIGYSYFRKMFKKFTGISPGQYTLQVRVARAKDLLITTENSIKDIAYETGFESVYYFSRIFKEKMGKTPTDLRNSVLKPVDYE
jgi:AraC-like DNA-binding protein/mannose-6-phosphate isomerase-like protein (cupin superfamily)